MSFQHLKIFDLALVLILTATAYFKNSSVIKLNELASNKNL